jgi:hypothetical protein
MQFLCAAPTRTSVMPTSAVVKAGELLQRLPSDAVDRAESPPKVACTNTG